MANKQVRVVGKRRAEIDIRRLAEALLDFVDSLSETQKQQLSREGKADKNLGSRSKAKGSAA